MSFTDLFNPLTQALFQLSWQNLVMLGVGLILIYLAIAKEYEPVLLLPIGFGAILANLPLTGITEGEGFLAVIQEAGVANEIFPLLIFIGIGAMTTFFPAALMNSDRILLAKRQVG